MWGGEWQVHWLDEVDSTNTYVPVTRPAAGRPQGLVAVADHQTAGRGRLDRRWESPPGANLLASVLLRPGVRRRRRAPVHGGGGPGRRPTPAGRSPGWSRCSNGPTTCWSRAPSWPASWPRRSSRARPWSAVVVGIGINVAWPGPAGGGRDLPGRLGHGGAAGGPPGPPRAPPGRALGPPARCSTTPPGGGALADEMRRRCATLGQAVRVDPGRRGVHRAGRRRSTTPARLVVETASGPRPVTAGRRGPPAAGLTPGRARGPGLTLAALCAFSSREVPVSSGRTSPATGSNSTPRTMSSSTTCSPMPATAPTCPTSRTGSSSSRATSATRPPPRRRCGARRSTRSSTSPPSPTTPWPSSTPASSSAPTSSGPRPCSRRRARWAWRGSTTSSTCEVYGDLPLDTDEVFTEDSPYRPRTPYNASKAGADHAVRAYAETYELPITITNCANNYGPVPVPREVDPALLRAGARRQGR